MTEFSTYLEKFEDHLMVRLCDGQIAFNIDDWPKNADGSYVSIRYETEIFCPETG